MIDKIKRFDAKSEKNKRIIYYIVYTLIFVLMVPLVYAQFGVNGKTFIWKTDGLSQHFPVLAHFATILRQSFLSVFSGDGLKFPLWDFSIGAGADIITTLNYYGVGDPLNLLVILFPLSKMEYAYTILILLRIYLAGVTFTAYCKEMGCGRWNTLCGALAYIFCGYALVAGVRHPFFINPMMILPLLLMGIERIFKRKRPYIFIFAVFYAAITSVYFFYIVGVLAGIYVLVRSNSYCKENSIRTFLEYIGKFIGYIGVGILLSGVIFIPNIIALLGSTRMKTDAIVRLFFEAAYYRHLPINFLGVGERTNWTIVGYVSLVAIAIFMMFSYRRKYTQLKVGFIILTIMVCTPYAGYVMNGFSHVSNRWIFGYGFLLSFIMVKMLPQIINIDVKRFKALLVVAAIYLAYVCWVLFDSQTPEKIRRTAGLALSQYLIVIIVMISIFAWSYIAKRRGTDKNREIRTIIMKCALLMTVVVNIFFQANWLFLQQGGNYVAEFLAPGVAYERQTEVANIVNSINDKEEFYRYCENAYDAGHLENNALIAQLYGNSLYYSLNDVNYFEYMHEIECNDANSFLQVRGLDSRTGISALSATKYYITETNKESYIPYGHTRLTTGERLSLYKNEYYLPLGYTYQSYIPREKYKVLDAIQKEGTMLQGVVLDKEVIGLPILEPEKQTKECSFEIECGDGVAFADGKFVVNKKNSEAVMKVKGLSNSETYLNIRNLVYEPPIDQKQIVERAAVEISDDGDKSVEGQVVKKRIDVQTPNYKWYPGVQNFTVNMGYALRAKNELTIKFSKKGEYTFDKLSIICQPMDNHAQQVNKLKEDVLENVVIGTNKINGTLDLNDTKFLCMSIPYSKGWSIYVNGEKRELLRANTAYMGVELDAGHHEIELRYFTPYLKISIICTVLGIISFVAIILWYRRKKRGKENEI